MRHVERAWSIVGVAAQKVQREEDVCVLYRCERGVGSRHGAVGLEQRTNRLHSDAAV
jgi:hypothetical protein